MADTIRRVTVRQVYRDGAIAFDWRGAPWLVGSFYARWFPGVRVGQEWLIRWGWAQRADGSREQTITEARRCG